MFYATKISGRGVGQAQPLPGLCQGPQPGLHLAYTSSTIFFTEWSSKLRSMILSWQHCVTKNTVAFVLVPTLTRMLLFTGLGHARPICKSARHGIQRSLPDDNADAANADGAGEAEDEQVPSVH